MTYPLPVSNVDSMGVISEMLAYPGQIIKAPFLHVEDIYSVDRI